MQISPLNCPFLWTEGQNRHQKDPAGHSFENLVLYLGSFQEKLLALGYCQLSLRLILMPCCCYGVVQTTQKRSQNLCKMLTDERLNGLGSKWTSEKEWVTCFYFDCEIAIFSFFFRTDGETIGDQWKVLGLSSMRRVSWSRKWTKSTN